MTGTLVLAGMPIGRDDDASPALREALITADVIAAEDTRRLKNFARRVDLSLEAKIVSYFDGNESQRASQLARYLADGLTVVQVSDAGMPTVSDPGYRLINQAIEIGARVTAVPGPSAVTTALAVSGLASDRFCFEGFLPRKAQARAQRLRELATETRTMVFFESPRRLHEFVVSAVGAFGGSRPAAVTRELTKVHEEIIRGSLDDIVQWAAGEVLGEITVVIAGRPAGDTEVETDHLDQALQRIADGERLSEVVSDIAATAGLNRREFYDAVVNERRKP
jgi:16S rRNA (cytidine1402-2'-O)-methyltransferase